MGGEWQGVFKWRRVEENKGGRKNERRAYEEGSDENMDRKTK